jgi:hypothetical protein
MQCGEWLKAAMIEAEGEALGFTPRGTLQKAREELGVTQAKGNVRRAGQSWEWRLVNEATGGEGSNGQGSS